MVAGAAAAHAVRQVSKQRQMETFRKYDADGSGAIDSHELQLALADLGLEASSTEVDASRDLTCDSTSGTGISSVVAGDAFHHKRRTRPAVGDYGVGKGRLSAGA